MSVFWRSEALKHSRCDLGEGVCHATKLCLLALKSLGTQPSRLAQGEVPGPLLADSRDPDIQQVRLVCDNVPGALFAGALRG